VAFATDQQFNFSITSLRKSWDMEESAISKNPPSDLLRLHLVERERHGDGFHYRSVLHNYLQVEFPGIDAETLVQRLF
jgi:hypothetical protein